MANIDKYIGRKFWHNGALREFSHEFYQELKRAINEINKGRILKNQAAQ